MSAPVQKGDILAGKYRVEELLAQGGMGVVVAATHLHLDQRVALKFILPDAVKNPELIERFAREARAAAKIMSEHVARVSDVGMLEGGVPYMVMEHLEGDDLEDVLKDRKRLPISEAVGFLLQVCEAIAEAHSLGIIHRDLKPSNLFLAKRPDGSVSAKVLDFGLSKLTHNVSQEASLTHTSAVMGSPQYMSPEQLRSSKDVDARSDIWSLGVTLYEMIGGRLPFATGTVPEVCASILKDVPVPLSAVHAEVPDGLEAAILRCLQKDAQKRYQNVAELATAILSFAPPGSEISIERISNVLRQAASRSSQKVEVEIDAGRATVPEAITPAVVPAADKPEEPPDPLAATRIDKRVEEETPKPPPSIKPLPVQLPSAAPPPAPSETTGATSISQWTPSGASKPSRVRLIAGAGAAAVALIVGVLVARSGGGPAARLEAGVAAAAQHVPLPALPSAEPASPPPQLQPPPEPVATALPTAAPSAPAPARTGTPRPAPTASAAPASSAAPSSTAAASTSPTSAPTSTAAPTASAKAAPPPTASASP